MHVKKILFLFAIILINIISPEVYASTTRTMTNIDLIGEGAILIEKDSEEILFEKNINQKMYPASTTKIMTAIIALEYGELDDEVTVGDEIDEIPWYSGSANLVEGDKLSLHDLLYGLLLPSGNDAANTIAVHISQKTSGNLDITLKDAHNIFSDLMNQKSKEIGASNTNFMNPHGFHHEEQYTSPWDMAIIGKYAMENEIFREVVATSEASYYKDIVWETTNHLIIEDNENYYPFTTGVKTGKTAAAGKCLVSSASMDGLDLISVVLKSTDDHIWPDTTSLLNYGFDNFKNHILITEGDNVQTLDIINRESNEPESLDIQAEETLKTFINIEDIDKIEEEVTLSDIYFWEDSEEENLRALLTVNKGSHIGSIRYLLGDEVIGESTLIADSEIIVSEEGNEPTPWTLIYGIIIIIILISILIIRNRRKVIEKTQ